MESDITGHISVETMENWVKLRYNCSPYEIFLKLRAGAEEDVKTISALKKDGEQVSFRIMKNGNSFTVLRESPRSHASVEFKWSEHQITVLPESITNFNRAAGKPLEATLTLTDEGECKLRVGQEILSCAQFRKKVLEDLFFNF